MRAFVHAAMSFVVVLSIAGCDGDSTGAMDAGERDAGTDAGVDAGIDGGTDAGPGDAGTDASADAALPPGACSNTEDEAALAAIDVDEEAAQCGGECFGGRTCVTMCMKELGLSNACAACFGDVAACTAGSCAAQCVGGNTPQCTECRREAGCVDEFEACSGLPGS